MSRRETIGFDRRIDLSWLDAAAAQAARGATPEELRAYLWDLLEGVVKGEKRGSARYKTVFVLNHIWGAVPEEAAALRQRAAALVGQSTPEERLALHWAMTLGTYPIFSDTAAHIGRLLALQDEFTLAHITRRLVSVWGERSTLTRAVQRIVRSMIQWGVLIDTEVRGVYRTTGTVHSVSLEVILILIEALLIDSDRTAIAIASLRNHPALFPFQLDVYPVQLHQASHFQVHREGLDTDVVALR